MPIKTLMFDLGKVIIPLDEKSMHAAFDALGAKDAAAKFATVEGKELWRRYDRDMPTEEFRTKVIKLLELPDKTEPHKIDAAWNALLAPIPEDTFKVLEELRKRGYEILLFSNSNEVHHSLIQKLYGERFAKIFHEQHYSHHFKKAKPEPKAFLHVLQNRVLSTVLFFDDKKPNTDSAYSLGIHVVPFTPGKSFNSIHADILFRENILAMQNRHLFVKKSDDTQPEKSDNKPALKF